MAPQYGNTPPLDALLMCRTEYWWDKIIFFIVFITANNISWGTGPCVTTTIWRYHTPIIQWQHSFHVKACHWLRGLRQRQMAAVILSLLRSLLGKYRFCNFPPEVGADVNKIYVKWQGDVFKQQWFVFKWSGQLFSYTSQHIYSCYLKYSFRQWWPTQKRNSSVSGVHVPNGSQGTCWHLRCR